MNSRRKGEDLLPRLAPIPRHAMSAPVRGGPVREGGVCDRHGVSHRVADAIQPLAAGVRRTLGMLPVLEVLGIIALFFLLAQ